MYTDGLSEMMDADEREFGDKRIGEHAIKYRHQPVDAICSKMINSVKQFAADPAPKPGTSPIEIDDMTLVIIKALEEGGDRAIG